MKKRKEYWYKRKGLLLKEASWQAYVLQILAALFGAGPGVIAMKMKGSEYGSIILLAAFVMFVVSVVIFLFLAYSNSSESDF